MTERDATEPSDRVATAVPARTAMRELAVNTSLLMLALYFKFNRIWSVRNIDLFLLIVLAPGLLLVQWAAENAGVHARAANIQHLGFLWLLITEGLLLVRLLHVGRVSIEKNIEAFLALQIDADKIDRSRGMDITIVTTAQTDDEGRALLRQLGFPFKEK